MNILVITNNYPSKRFPNHGAFLYNLIQELAVRHQITVISPNKLHQSLRKQQATYGKERCEVYRPLYFSISNRKIAGINTGKISDWFYDKAVKRILGRLSAKPDVIYVHFLSNALPVLDHASQHDIPLVIASGESTYASWVKKPVSLKSALTHQVNHVICVSKENRDQLIELGFAKDKLSVIPNAVDYELFKPLDKEACRRKLGLSLNKFTVGFVGHFIHRKGPQRIIAAIESLNDKDVQLLCVGGKGSLKPNDFMREMGPVPNFRLPEIYNSFDVFVLPTLHEGHCNVIEEAKACGIPIISSKGTSVEEQIDESVGILVDPMNIEEIASAINLVKKDSALRERMISNLLERRGSNSLYERANKIEKILAGVCEGKGRP